MADEKILLEIEVDNEQAVQNLDKQNKEIIQLEKNQKKLAEQQGKNSKQYQLNNQRLKKARQERNQNLKLIKAESGSLNELRAKLAILTNERNNLTDVNGKNADSFKELNKEIADLSDSISKVEQEGKDFRRNVGNYPKILDSASDAAGRFGVSLDGISQIIKLNPLGLLLTGLTALIAAWSKTEKGAKFFKIALAVLNSVFETLVGSVGTFAQSIIDAFENPVQSIQTFANLVQNYVLEKVNALIDTFSFLGDVIKKVFEGDFDGALESAKKAGESFVNSAPIVDLFKAQVEAVSDFTDKVIENVNATVKLEEQNYKLQRSMLATQKQIAKLEGQEASLSKQAEDSTLSFQEQEKAQNELQKVQQQRFKLQEGLISSEISIINQRLEVAKRNNQDTLQLQTELTEKTKELIGVRNEAVLSETENLQITRQRNQDIWEQELDFIIDVGEKEREIFEKRANDESLSLEERQTALENYQTAYDAFLQAQRNQFDEIGLDDEELNRLLGIKDPEELAQAITDLENLSEVEKNRLREVFIEFKNAEIERAEVVRDSEEAIRETKTKTFELEIEQQEKLKEQRRQVAYASIGLINEVFNVAKSIGIKNERVQRGLAITQAGINTAVGVTKALSSSPPPLNFVNATAVGLAGAAQIAAIQRSNGGQTSAPSAPSLNSNVSTPNTSQIDQQLAQQEALEAAIGNLGLTVSVTEINEVQNNVSVSEATAQI